MELEQYEDSVKWKSNNYIKESLLKLEGAFPNALNVTLHTRTTDKINLELDIQHFYNKVSYQIKGGKHFRKYPVFNIFAFIERAKSENGTNWKGLHAHAIVIPPSRELISFHDFYHLLKETWKSTRFGRSIAYIQPVRNWEGCVEYISNPHKGKEDKDVLAHFISHGKPLWEYQTTTDRHSF